MNRSVGIGVIAALIVAALAAYLSLFTVNMTQQAIVLQFGRPVGQVITEPGLYVKVPLIQNVVYIDKRLLNLEVSDGGNHRLRSEAPRGRRFRALPHRRCAEVLSDRSRSAPDGDAAAAELRFGVAQHAGRQQP